MAAIWGQYLERPLKLPYNPTPAQCFLLAGKLYTTLFVTHIEMYNKILWLDIYFLFLFTTKICKHIGLKQYKNNVLLSCDPAILQLVEKFLTAPWGVLNICECSTSTAEHFLLMVCGRNYWCEKNKQN